MASNTISQSSDLIVIPWHLDEYLPAFPVPASTSGLARPALPAGSRTNRMTVLYREIADAVARAGKRLILSGDCTTALGVVAGLQRRHRDLAVVWLDGHGDFNTPDTTITGYLGGMPLAMLAGRADQLIGDPLGLRPVPDSNIVLADARDLDPAERDALAASRVRRVAAGPAAIAAAVARLGRMPVYLHVDVDIIDSSQLPGLRVPAGAGPSRTEVEDCLAAAVAAADIAAATIACTWLPGQMTHPSVTRTVTRLAHALGHTLSW